MTSLATGDDLYDLIVDLYPECRSITGDGVRRTIERLGEIIPLERREIATGTQVFDWTVPKEWNIDRAWIADASGEKIVNFDDSNLHVVSYSVPVDRRMPLSELRPHLHTVPDQPHLIPYRTSYYEETWGFCLSQDQLRSLKEGEYHVFIDSTLEPGHLSLGELVLPGEIEDEFLISTHICHPSLANDNLSGIAVATFLALHLSDSPRRHTFRFLFIPGTIGSITWLATSEAQARQTRHGMVLSCLGDGGQLTYKRSRRGDAVIDRAAEHVLRHAGSDRVRDFVPYGYDERQYCSPGFDLPVGSLSRTPHGEYPEYHTSADNLELLDPESLEDSLRRCLEIVRIVEGNRIPRNLAPNCEPQLGRRGLYRKTGGQTLPGFEMALLWVLNLGDGSRTLLDISDRADLTFETVALAAERLCEAGLISFQEN